MSKALTGAPIAFFTFLAMLSLASVTISAGVIPNDTVSLWAGAILAGDGKFSLGHIIAAYPTIPFLATAALEFVMPAGAPTPALLAGGLAALLAAIWFVSFRGAGLSFAVALLATALLVFHPALLQATMAGPAETLVALFLFLLAAGLFKLRVRGAAPEAMLVSFALVGLAFSHPMGAAIACAAVPYLVLAVPPTLVANSALNMVFLLIFPAIFAVAAFTYVSWVFPGSGWSFYSAPSESLAAWATSVNDLFGGGLTGVHALDAAIAFTFALAIGAPLALIIGFEMRRRAPLVAPPLVLAAASVTAAAISVATGWFGDPAAVAVTAPILCAAIIMRIPSARDDVGRMLGLLALGWAGGALALVLIDPRAVAQFRGGDLRADSERLAALNIGRVTAGRDGVLVDTDNAPEVVVGRGDAQGLLPPSDPRFTLVLLFNQLNTPFVAVPDPQSATGAADRIDRAFPALYRHGAPGYRLIFENAIWRLYGREPRSAQ